MLAAVRSGADAASVTGRAVGPPWRRRRPAKTTIGMVVFMVGILAGAGVAMWVMPTSSDVARASAGIAFNERTDEDGNRGDPDKEVSHGETTART